MLLLLFFFLLFLILFASFKWTKQEVAKTYGVSRKTLKKWVVHFCPKSYSKHWGRVRKLNIFSLLVLTSYLGAVDQEGMFSKKALLKKCDSDYLTMRACIALNLDKLNFNEDTYASMDIFPPKVSSMIIEALG